MGSRVVYHLNASLRHDAAIVGLVKALAVLNAQTLYIHITHTPITMSASFSALDAVAMAGGGASAIVRRSKRYGATIDKKKFVGGDCYQAVAQAHVTSKSPPENLEYHFLNSASLSCRSFGSWGMTETER